MSNLLICKKCKIIHRFSRFETERSRACKKGGFCCFKRLDTGNSYAKFKLPDELRGHTYRHGVALNAYLYIESWDRYDIREGEAFRILRKLIPNGHRNTKYLRRAMRSYHSGSWSKRFREYRYLKSLRSNERKKFYSFCSLLVLLHDFFYRPNPYQYIMRLRAVRKKFYEEKIKLFKSRLRAEVRDLSNLIDNFAHHIGG